jgi:glycosyltransferase involved in cell wall biosynthesis
VIGSLQGGGAERQISDMANYWAARGLEVALATWSGPEISDFYALDRCVRRVHLNVDAQGSVVFPRLRANLRRVLKLRALIRSTLPDAVLSFVTETNVLTILAGVGLKARVVVSERTQPALHSALPWQWQLLRKILYSRSDEVVAQTWEAAQWITQNCRKRARVIPNALRSLPDISKRREPLIIAIGRLAHEKGFDLLLRAFARIAPDFADWRVAIIGTGPEQANLMRLRDELSLTGRVDFAGQIADVPTWMARAGLVVQPSRFEGFPNVVLESMGMGAPVISNDCPSGLSDLIDDGINGRLVPVEDVVALAQTMTELMSQPQIRERLGREAVNVRQRYRQDLIMAQWDACLLAASVDARTNGDLNV